VIGHFDTTCEFVVGEVIGLCPEMTIEPLPNDHPIPLEQDFVVGSIGFVGKAMRGSLTLAATPDVWEKFAPKELELAADRPIALTMLCDMVGELGNLLLGRFRNRLLRCGVEIASATPTAVYGRLGQVQCLRSKQSAWLAFRAPAGELYVRLDASFDDSFSLPGPVRVEPNVDALTLF
jgi:CheY-specific phosphatase CheX